ncbi:MAG: transposase [Flavisolibacter sp.]
MRLDLIEWKAAESNNVDVLNDTIDLYRYFDAPKALWYNEVEASAIESFKTVARSIQTHYLDILNFFTNRSTNASAESFNAKVKAFRATQRGVRDVTFFLFRLSKIYAQ